MGHEMHMLEGFILDSNPYGESGRILKILTKEYGVMTVVATGVRELYSKMRGSMDILQLVTFEYVEGREMNRLTGLHEKRKYENLFVGDTKEIIQKRSVVSNVVNFVLRTVIGETHNEKLWDSFLEGMEKLEQISDPPNLEVIWLIKILVSLGYWEEGKMDAFTTENFAFLNNLETGEKNRKEIIEKINNSIRSSHL